MATNSLYTHYIAIDFGTSGCAIAVGFSKPEPKKINVFSGWDGAKAAIQIKYPTILLADPKGDFVSFGIKAAKAFEKLKGKAQDYYLFHRFKMKLYDNPDAEFIEAANGKCLPTVDVYAMTLKFLKDTALEWVQRLTEHPYQKIQWIVTVPAIWSDAAKDTMRKAAMKVDLKKESMVLAYEPEAAALFTQYDFLQGDAQFCYLVVDCGGGTVDIAAHKIIKQDGNIVINDIAPPHGGNCGGFAVNDQFEKLLTTILNISSEKFKQLKIKCAVQWNKLMNENFEGSKITLDPDDKSSAITLQVPSKIYDEVEKITGKPFEDLIDEYGDESIEWDEDECGIILNYSAVDKLFQPVLDEICKLIRTVLAKEECNEIKTLLLVGGFAESECLFQRIKNTFGNEYNVKRSSTPAYSVVKGAVLCGQQERLIKPLLENMDDQPTTLEPHHEPADTQSVSESAHLAHQNAPLSPSPTMQTEKHLPPSKKPVDSPMEIVKHLPPALTKHLPVVLSRKMRYTVGVETVEEFQIDNHDVNKLVLIDKEQYCEDIFFTLVRANESVHAGSPKRIYKFLPATEEQSICIINIFASEQENVKYIDDAGCQHRAKAKIPIPGCDTNLSREIHLCVNFYNTEVEIEAYNVTYIYAKDKIAVEYQFFHAQS